MTTDTQPGTRPMDEFEEAPVAVTLSIALEADTGFVLITLVEDATCKVFEDPVSAKLFLIDFVDGLPMGSPATGDEEDLISHEAMKHLFCAKVDELVAS